jgi:chemotaxis protein MotB
MARKKKHPEHVNHERWLISYADFITLLFAFFVVMFAVSQVDTKQVGRFTESFTDALEWQVFDAKGGKGFMPADKRIQPLVGQSVKPVGKAVLGHNSRVRVDESPLGRELREKFKAVPELRDLQVIEYRDELVLRLPEQLLFESGDTRVNDDGQAALSGIADALKGRELELRVEGHTDNVPIKNLRYQSNWELSAGRSTSVVRYFIEACKMAPERFAAAGYGEFRPVAANDSSEGRAQNRRVDVVLIAATSEEPERPDGGPATAPASSSAR